MNNESLTIKTVAEYYEFQAEMYSTPENEAYLYQVYRLLKNMKPGTRIEIDRLVKPANLPKFIRCVCLYFWDIDNTIEFDREYKFIKKLEPFPYLCKIKKSNDKHKNCRCIVLIQWYSTFFVRVIPHILSLQLCTPKVIGA